MWFLTVTRKATCQRHGLAQKALNLTDSSFLNGVSEQLLVRYLSMLIRAYYEYLLTEVIMSVTLDGSCLYLAVEQVKCAWIMV